MIGFRWSQYVMSCNRVKNYERKIMRVFRNYIYDALQLLTCKIDYFNLLEAEFVRIKICYFYSSRSRIYDP